MTPDVASATLNQHLDEFRGWSYTSLATKVDEIRRNHDCLYAVEGATGDGERYFIEINVFWDDKPGGDVRVIGDLSSLDSPRRGRFFGFLPVFTPDLVDSFIMAPDGSFIGE